MTARYFSAPEIFDGEQSHRKSALKTVDGLVAEIIDIGEVPAGADLVFFEAGMIAPGFVDLQVNGGGGVLMNDAPTVEAIRTICEAHARFGTTSLLATLITDTPEATRAALKAGIEAERTGACGFAGLHIEGPHLSVARKGTHDPAMIRPMMDQDLAELLEAKRQLRTLYVTIAPESVSLEQVEQLARAGVIVSLGHTDCSFETALKYVSAGARCVTHLFNAMSQIGNREPGLVGAALASGKMHAGLIADGHHVHHASMSAALRAKTGPGKIHLVTDAMSTVGSDISGFTLNGREILRSGGRLTLADGTLAGADIDMNSCIRNAYLLLGLSKEEALQMAARNPAECIGRNGDIGSLAPDARADFVHLDDSLTVKNTYIAGKPAAQEIQGSRS
jgi:N-acetylglucosamine-6-phosphate deacetylase